MSEFCYILCKQTDINAMKIYSFFVSFILAIAVVSGFSTKEHVKRFFRPEHRALLPDLTSFQIEDENAVARAPQKNYSTRCLAYCEPDCKKLDLPEFLTVRKFHSVRFSLSVLTKVATHSEFLSLMNASFTRFLI